MGAFVNLKNFITMAKSKVTTPEEVVEEVLPTEETIEESPLIEEAPKVTLNEAPAEVPQTGHSTRAFRS